MSSRSPPRVVTTFSLDPEFDVIDEEEVKKDEDRKKELVLMGHIIFNGLLLLTLIILYLVPVYKGRNCFSTIPTKK